MTSRRTWLILALLVVVVLALLFVAPAHAHGGEGDALQGQAASWMVGLIYVQLFMIPVVGVWLAGEAVAAWRPRPNL